MNANLPFRLNQRSTTLRMLLLAALLGLLSMSHALATPAGACAISEGQWGGGPPNDAERWSDMSEDLLVVGAGAELLVFDIAMPTAPVELGRVLVGHPATSVALSPDGQMAAVSDWHDNLTLVDISNRGAPAKRGSYAWPGIQQPTGMAFDGDYLLVAVRTIGLAVLDISDPDNPAFVANSDGSVSDFVFDVALRGDHAYLGQGDDGVQIVDISDPNAPTVVGNVASWVGTGQIDIVGNRAYVARGGYGFGILDLSTPAAPAELGGFDTDGFAYETALLSGDRLAVADGFAGTVVFDIGTPGTPVPLGSFGINPYRLVALDERVFIVPAFGSRVRLVDFQTPATPNELGHIDFDGLSGAVSVGVDHVLVANGDGGLVMLDTANPVQPGLVGRVDIDAQRVGHVNGHGVASAGYDGNISVIDPQPGGPVAVTSIDNGFPSNDLVGDGNLLYVASGEFGGLRIHDLSNPASPQPLGGVVPTDETVWQIAVADGYAYSGYILDADLLVIDVSNPAIPAEIGSHTLPASTYPGAVDIAASGNHVFVGTQVNGVRILQHDGLGNLSEVADIDVFPAVVTGVSIDGNRLHISAGEFSGLLTYDVTDPSDPQFVEQHNTAGEGLGVAAANGVIAMAEGSSGASTFGCDLGASNQPPVAVGAIGNQSSDEGESIFPLSTHPNFDDPDGQALSFSATGLPPGLGITAGSGVVEGTLGYDAAGSYPVTITATDPFGLFATQSFSWTVADTDPLLFRSGFE